MKSEDSVMSCTMIESSCRAFIDIRGLDIARYASVLHWAGLVALGNESFNSLREFRRSTRSRGPLIHKWVEIWHPKTKTHRCVKCNLEMRTLELSPEGKSRAFEIQFFYKGEWQTPYLACEKKSNSEKV